MKTACLPAQNTAATVQAAPLLQVQAVGFGYGNAGRRRAGNKRSGNKRSDSKRSQGSPLLFSEVSFSLKRGEILAILGANGAGKTTLLDCMTGVHKPQTGSIFLQGKALESISLRERAHIMAYVPQISMQGFSYQVCDYVALGCAAHLGILNTPGPTELARVDHALQRLNIQHLRNKACNQLSGGEFQQVQIARALVQDPQLILLDEPTNHLDFGNQIKILTTIRELAQDGITVILTTHNPDHIILLEGKVGILDNAGHFHIDEAACALNEECLRGIYGVQIYLEHCHQAGRLACVSGTLGDCR